MSLFEQYQELLEHQLPETEEQSESFLDIAGYPNYENVFSNIYAHFLNEGGAHGMKRMFLDALQNALNLEIIFGEYAVVREFATKNGRLDILIEERDENENLVHAMGIENKVFHELNNDLADYQKSIKSLQGEALVVLTVHEVSDQRKDVHYLTHKRWVSEIKKLMGNYVIGVDTKQLLLLTDFIQHIENLYIDIMDTEGLGFLYEYGNKIQGLKDLENTGREQLLDSISIALVDSANWSWDAKIPSGLRTYGKNKDHIVYININDVFSSHEIKFEYWIKRTDKNEEKYSPDLITNIYKKFKLGEEDYHQKNYWFLKEAGYEKLSKDEIENMGAFVIQKIDEEFLTLMEAIEKEANG
jgi:hypothetical protein